MSEFTIQDSDLVGVKDSVVVITGASSGIGFETAKLLLELGAKVIGGDLQPPKAGLEHQDFIFVKADVTSWNDVINLFATGMSKYGRIDHTFANAGIGRMLKYLDDTLDESGNLEDPGHPVIDVNITGVYNTVKVGVHHMKKNDKLGSVVVTASAAGLLGIGNIEYGMSKFAAVGMVRDLATILHPEVPVRINGLAPAWTDTNIIPPGVAEEGKLVLQPASAVARSAVLLMADETRHGELIYSQNSKFCEMNKPIIQSLLQLLPAWNADKTGLNSWEEREDEKQQNEQSNGTKAVE